MKLKKGDTVEVIGGRLQTIIQPTLDDGDPARFAAFGLPVAANVGYQLQRGAQAVYNFNNDDSYDNNKDKKYTVAKRDKQCEWLQSWQDKTIDVQRLQAEISGLIHRANNDNTNSNGTAPNANSNTGPTPTYGPLVNMIDWGLLEAIFQIKKLLPI